MDHDAVTALDLVHATEQRPDGWSLADLARAAKASDTTASEMLAALLLARSNLNVSE